MYRKIFFGLVLFSCTQMAPQPQFPSKSMNIKCIGTTISNYREGLWTCFYNNGLKSSQSYYLKGKRNGEARHWKENGTLDFIANWRDGLFEGISIQFFNNGLKKEESSFKSGRLHGMSRSFFESGKIATESIFYHGRLAGAYREWNEDGILIAEWPGESNRFEALLDEEHRQLVIVKGRSSSHRASLELYESTSEKIEAVLGPVDAIVGQNGIAWPGENQESDGKTPDGLFAIETPSGENSKIVISSTRFKDLYLFAISDIDQPTNGSIALSESHFNQLLSLLDNKKKPLIWISGGL